LSLLERMVDDAIRVTRIVFALNRVWQPTLKRLADRVAPLAHKPERLAERIEEALTEPDPHRALLVMTELQAETAALAPDGANLAYVQDGEVTQIEGDPASPISRGRLCPKGAASQNYVQSPLREYKVKYRRPYGTRWEELSLDDAMEMIVDRFLKTREETWQEQTPEGDPARRTMGIANLGRATLDNEENYLIKKLLTSPGVV